MTENNQKDEEIIDRVKEVRLEFKNHRGDPDFERMFAELNQKKQTAKQPAEPSRKKPTEETHSPAPIITYDEKPAPKKDADKEKPIEKKPAAEDKPEVKPERKPVAVATAVTFPITEHLSEEEEEEKEPPCDEIEPERLNGLWQNPKLSDGGKITLNIKTDFRREIKISLPNPPPAEPIISYEEDEAQEDETEDLSADTQARVAAFVEDQRQQRRRQREKRKKAAVVRRHFAAAGAMLCCAAVFTFGFYLLVCQKDSSVQKPSFSVGALLDGSYFDELTKRFSNCVPQREKLKSLGDRLRFAQN